MKFLSEQSANALGEFVTRYLRYPLIEAAIPRLEEGQFADDVRDALRKWFEHYNEMRRREYCTALYLTAKKFVESYEANDLN